jgi:hypothetical protein
MKNSVSDVRNLIIYYLLFLTYKLYDNVLENIVSTFEQRLINIILLIIY